MPLRRRSSAFVPASDPPDAPAERRSRPTGRWSLGRGRAVGRRDLRREGPRHQTSPAGSRRHPARGLGPGLPTCTPGRKNLPHAGGPHGAHRSGARLPVVEVTVAPSRPFFRRADPRGEEDTLDEGPRRISSRRTWAPSTCQSRSSASPRGSGARRATTSKHEGTAVQEYIDGVGLWGPRRRRRTTSLDSIITRAPQTAGAWSILQPDRSHASVTARVHGPETATAEGIRPQGPGRPSPSTGPVPPQDAVRVLRPTLDDGAPGRRRCGLSRHRAEIEVGEGLGVPPAHRECGGNGSRLPDGRGGVVGQGAPEPGHLRGADLDLRQGGQCWDRLRAAAPGGPPCRPRPARRSARATTGVAIISSAGPRRGGLRGVGPLVELAGDEQVSPGVRFAASASPRIAWRPVAFFAAGAFAAK